MIGLFSIPTGLNDHEILSQVTMLLFAGYETSATTLTFLAYTLARNPAVMKHLQQEIDSTFPQKVDQRFWLSVNVHRARKLEKK